MRRNLATRRNGHKRVLAGTRSERGWEVRDSRGEREACPLYTAIAVIEGRWKPMLFQRLSAGPLGFGELRRAMPGVAVRVLREQLRQMQADGLVVRRPLNPAWAGVRYRLTPYGRTLAPVFSALWRWGTKHLARRGAAGGTRVAAPALAPGSDVQQSAASPV